MRTTGNNHLMATGAVGGALWCFTPLGMCIDSCTVTPKWNGIALEPSVERPHDLGNPSHRCGPGGLAPVSVVVVVLNVYRPFSLLETVCSAANSMAFARVAQQVGPPNLGANASGVALMGAECRHGSPKRALPRAPRPSWETSRPHGGIKNRPAWHAPETSPSPTQELISCAAQFATSNTTRETGEWHPSTSTPFTLARPRVGKVSGQATERVPNFPRALRLLARPGSTRNQPWLAQGGEPLSPPFGVVLFPSLACRVV